MKIEELQDIWKEMSTELEKQKKLKSLSNGCAICLSRYKVGDTLVWSTNPDCPHAYHQDCIIEYLARIEDDNSTSSCMPCPCCRQDFCIPIIAEQQQNTHYRFVTTLFNNNKRVKVVFFFSNGKIACKTKKIIRIFFSKL